MTREEALNTLLFVGEAIVGVVNETPQGAPAGPMYLAFIQYGMSLETFDAITGALVDTGRIRRRGDVFYPVNDPNAVPFCSECEQGADEGHASNCSKRAWHGNASDLGF